MNTRYQNLAQYFPSIRKEEQIRKEIEENLELSVIFDSWRKDQQEDFLSICSGAKGVKMLYDSFFKEICAYIFYSLRQRTFVEYVAEFHIHSG